MRGVNVILAPLKINYYRGFKMSHILFSATVLRRWPSVWCFSVSQVLFITNNPQGFFFYYFIFQLCVFSLCVFSSVSNVFHGVPQVRLSSLHLCLVSCYVTSYFILVVPCLVCLVLGVTSLCLIYFSFLSQVSSFCQNQLSIHILSQALLVLCWVVLHGCV